MQPCFVILCFTGLCFRKGTEAGGSLGKIGPFSPVLLRHAIGQVMHGRGRKRQRKCWNLLVGCVHGTESPQRKNLQTENPQTEYLWLHLSGRFPFWAYQFLPLTLILCLSQTLWIPDSSLLDLLLGLCCRGGVCQLVVRRSPHPWPQQHGCSV